MSLCPSEQAFFCLSYFWQNAAEPFAHKLLPHCVLPSGGHHPLFSQRAGLLIYSFLSPYNNEGNDNKRNTHKEVPARVKARNMETTLSEPISEDSYKVVEGYVSIAAVNLPYGTAEPQYISTDWGAMK